MSRASIGVKRHFTSPDTSVYDMMEWEERTAFIGNRETGQVAFEQANVEFPKSWSQTATNIVSQKYFRGSLGASDRERSLKQLVGRVVDTITRWGDEEGYFASELEQETFRSELTYILLTQQAAFNSPVWFNVGVADVAQQVSACFILSVEDTMSSIKDWWSQEVDIFQGGSGAGLNLSALRGSMESIGGSANTSSGPLAFMQAADAGANAIKSGGKTRRAAKMVILDIDHPDVCDFIVCKQEAENISRALQGLEGFDVGFDGKHASWVPFQNANNSVRVTDEFMQAYLEDESWQLRARRSGEVVAELPARELMRLIAEAAWDCADPGMQFDSTINHWHTTPVAGRINGSNPCSEYMHLDNSSCNLASLNLLKFLSADGVFCKEDFLHVTRVMFLAQDIMISRADYPTRRIAINSRSYRQIGIGYANLGAMLMAVGLPYDSSAGRAMAAAITALLTGESYRMSTKIAHRMGSFDGFDADRDAMLRVLGMHAAAVQNIEPHPLSKGLVDSAAAIWSAVCADAQKHGVRNAQASVLAPTGTIAFMMDCDTTGIEPDFALIKEKQLVGGGKIMIVNQTVELALQRLGYSTEQIAGIKAHIDRTGSLLEAPGFNAEHARVFETATGENAIHYQGHLGMMAAVQPFISGAISKTVNLPEATSVEEIEALYVEAWQQGIKALAIYRDNSKVAQPLVSSAPSVVESAVAPSKQELPNCREARNYEFRVADVKGFVNVGLFDNGQPAEIFFHITKQGSTLSGFMDNFGIAISLGLQAGVPLESYVRKYVGTQFEPRGMTDDPDIRIANSLLDYIFRRLALDFLSTDVLERLHIFSVSERAERLAVDQSAASPVEPEPIGKSDPNAPMCGACGTQMIRSGSCFACTTCGTTSGCS